MEHIYFEAQLCSEIAILKEKSKKLKYCENRLTGGVIQCETVRSIEEA